MKKIALLLLVCIFATSKLFACDCDDILSDEESHLIFTGEVLGTKEIRNGIIFYEVTFKVISKRKGEIKTENITIAAPCLSVACCGVEFTEGKKYEVFTFISNSTGGRDYTDICTQTHLIE